MRLSQDSGHHPDDTPLYFLLTPSPVSCQVSDIYLSLLTLEFFVSTSSPLSYWLLEGVHALLSLSFFFFSSMHQRNSHAFPHGINV